MRVPRRTFSQLNRVAQLATRPLVDRFEYEMEPSLREVLAEHEKIVHVMSHGHAFAFVPLFRLVELMVENGGGHRRFIGAAHRFFYLPVIRRLGVQLTQVERALNFEEFVERFRGPDFNDFLVMPEGDHTLWGNGVDIVPFTSPRFIEIALQVGAPMLLMVHKGTEAWARSWPISEERLPLLARLPDRMRDVIASTGTFTFTARPRKLQRIRLRGFLYTPTLTLEDLSEDPAERREQLWTEANLIRAKMQQMLDEMID